MADKEVPHVKGAFLLGNVLPLLNNTSSFVYKWYLQLGNVFKTVALGKDVYILSGNEVGKINWLTFEGSKRVLELREYK